MKSILDPSFRYVPSRDTDLRKTFQRIRMEREAAKGRRTSAVVPIDRDRISIPRKASGGE